MCGIPNECALSISEYYLMTDVAHKAILSGIRSFAVAGRQFEVGVGCQTDVPENESFLFETFVMMGYVIYEVT